jgi:soluble lytic murein transglycosylase-like protein
MARLIVALALLPFRVAFALGARGTVALVCVLVLAVSTYGIAEELGLLESPAIAAPAHRPVRQPPASSAAAADIPRGYLQLYRQAGRRYGVPWSVLAGVGKVESDHGRVPGSRRGGSSSAGALGPMQFMPGTWQTWGRGRSVYEPAAAIDAAARFLRALGINHRPGWALAAYNAGPGRADQPPASTRRYVAAVTALARRYAAGRG